MTMRKVAKSYNIYGYIYLRRVNKGPFDVEMEDLSLIINRTISINGEPNNHAKVQHYHFFGL